MPMPTDLGIIDLMLGFPHTSIEEKRATYDFFRPLLKDEQSAKDFEFPAEYMFKGVPDVVDPDTDVVQWVVDKMDAFGIEVAMTGLTERGIEARERYPSRFVLNLSVRPNEGMAAIRAMTRAKEDHGIVSVSVFPCGQVPQVDIDSPLMYPVYAKCIEMDMPIMFGHVSLGSVSYNTQKALFMAAKELNIIAGSGEGGLHEDFYVYADHICSEVASGRFGVNAEYLKNTAAVEIKVGQGAKPARAATCRRPS